MKEQEEVKVGYQSLSYDLRRLTCYDANQVWQSSQNNEITFEEKDEFIKSRAQQNVVNIFNKLMSIKQQNDAIRDNKPDDLQVFDFSKNPFEIDIPEVPNIVQLPRSQKIPDIKKILTKWEKFAKEKGIRKKKKTKMIFDELTQDWVPRFGKHSIKKIQEHANSIKEVKEGEDPYEDPFKKEELEKKLNKEKQKLSELKNKLTKKGYNAKDVLSQFGQYNRTHIKHKGKIQKTQKLLAVAQNSTASMGDFDKKAHSEEKQKKIKRKKHIPDFQNTKAEKQRDNDMLDFVIKSKGQKKIKKEND